jgi:acyl-CoA synthetase (AMP-forming)/AMP-acid ligase II
VNRFLNLIDAFGAAPAGRPFVTAWSDDEDERKTVTFGEFRQCARMQAAMLLANGLAAGDRVIIIMPQSIAAMTTFVGAMMLGAIPAFLAYPNFKIEPTKYRSGLAGVTANIRARIVVIDDEFPDELLGHVSLDNETRLLRAGENTGYDGEVLPFPQIQAEDVAFIQHSAGTTGLQKGVALTHAAVLNQLEHLHRVLEIDQASDRIYSWLPLYHDMGLIACFMLPMVYHLPVVIESPMDWVMHPETMLQVIHKYKCTLAWLPNFAFQFIPRRALRSRWSQYDLSSVRALINCSEPVRAASMFEFQDAFCQIGLKSNSLQTSYAMAEAVFAVTQSDIHCSTGPSRIWADGQRFRGEHRVFPVAEQSQDSISFTSSGHLLPNTEVRIVSDTGAVLSAGCVGEILVKSDCLFQGYYNRPGLTAKAIIDGYFHTGDLGFYLGGELYVVGRSKDLLIVGGENLYPQDIEEIVAEHPAIHDGRAIAMGVYNLDLGTEEIIVVAEVERTELLASVAKIEQEVRCRIVLGLGVGVRRIFLKPPNWIVKSTAGKPARSSTRQKLLKEHPEITIEPQEFESL